MVHIVVGDPLSGIRIDVEDDLGGSLAALRFELELTPELPLRLTELGRLWHYYASGVLAASGMSRGIARPILLLRTIDALAEGASLRAIGDGLVRAGEWPGDGEWAKSRARRLVAGAQAMWRGGPRAILAGAADRRAEDCR
ncbi:hypothetical protein ATE68_01420 [Sphingopyxis sp. H038]|uniref:DNA -binding domain-containing protein n=1 Tax=unclassified Sphingopyxis TaxID=2614943 RepID=UPI00073085A0|nr:MULTISPECIES: DUF2285 domain-containing protein [unclassified Sphingopyxis]KTE04337.1 hypothetical protein ATE78_01420 [Sphingopyxis sp. H012]KTE10822.1 hypothetical protein ATE76_12920 [Sphingopyxis sp. H093]KTE13461.1 hypothetical protein ATE70_02005 [Sphingopyxis sp. H053]KTE31300.1 hypothetical protein ATE75_01975 [Sphingopyxis sp. H080]KTE36827.1 hypothetical protein ATE68_01420 [Sphingopyxis sp. H038]